MKLTMLLSEMFAIELTLNLAAIQANVLENLSTLLNFGALAAVYLMRIIS